MCFIVLISEEIERCRMLLQRGLMKHVDACLATVLGMSPMVIAEIIVAYEVVIGPTDIAHTLAFLEQTVHGRLKPLQRKCSGEACLIKLKSEKN